ncbi:MAG TPA: hypothetical protein VGQ00_03675 [Candidatus Norongarragalinales archaeon]|jgi:hypothetical protein|nr:hypothetical protein [Candidatus Norongarragalinales archaeon]
MPGQKTVEERLERVEQTLQYLKKVSQALLLVMAIILFIALGAVLKAAGI